MSIRLLFGCEPDKYAGNGLNVNAGSVGTFDGAAVWDRPVQDTVDLTHLGVGGADRVPFPAGHVYLYVLSNGAGGFGWIACPGRFESDVICPAGWTVVRKLPFGIPYNLAWGGIADFHLTGWPLPYIRLTQAQYGSPWTVLGAAQSHGVWRTLDLSALIPDNARLADIIVEVRYVSGQAGSGYVRSPGGSNPSGVFCGSANPGAIGNTLSLALRTDSNRQIEWMTTGDVELFITVLGYWMTEPA